MKKTVLSFTSLLLFLSCSNNNRPSVSTQNGDTIPFEIVDTISEDTTSKGLIDESASSPVLPPGYSKKKYEEYAPKNDIERRLIADLKEMSDATNRLDYKKVVSLYYPDYFKYLQKQIPDKTIPEIKIKFENYLKQNLAERNKEYTRIWSGAKYAGVVVTNIINRVTDRNGMLYLYEYHTILFSETDTIFKDEAEYSIAASLNNGRKWYTSANSIEENFEILGISFSRNAIDKVLTKD